MTTIDQEFDKFFEFDSADQSTVTSTSAKLFARYMMEQERMACFGALEIVMLMAKNGNYSGQEEAVQECMFAIQNRSNPTPTKEKI